MFNHKGAFRPGDIATKICYSFLGYFIANFFFPFEPVNGPMTVSSEISLFLKQVLDHSKMGIKIVPASWDCVGK